MKQCQLTINLKNRSGDEFQWDWSTAVDTILRPCSLALIANACDDFENFRDWKNLLKGFSSFRALDFVFIYFFFRFKKHFRYVWMIQQTCEILPTAFQFRFTLFSLSFSHEHKYFATFSLEGAIQKRSGVEYKNYLSYALFLSSCSFSLAK